MDSTPPKKVGEVNLDLERNVATRTTLHARYTHDAAYPTIHASDQSAQRCWIRNRARIVPAYVVSDVISFRKLRGLSDVVDS